MAAFEYIALDKKGRQKKGVLEADTPRQIRQQIREQGLTPVEVTLAVEKVKKSASTGFSLKRKVSAAELALITRQLSTLVAAGMPIEECLRAVGQQTDKPKLKTMILAVRSRVVEGYTLADSMGEFPHIFDELFCAMVAAGEKSGHLEKVLDRLADYTEQRQQMRSKLMQAMIYPIMLTLVAIGVISILLTSVVPQVVGQFEHMGQDLPASTQFLIGASDFLQDFGLFVVLGCILASFGFKAYLKNEKNRLKFHQLVLKLPVIGKVSKDLNTARFARTLSILNASAVPLLEGMGISGEVLTNLYTRKKVAEATDRVREGTSLGVALENTKLFPPMMLHMIASGERSGELEQMLERAADNQDKQFAAQVNMALGVFEPALVVSMAGVVLFIVAAILQPMLALNNMVGG